MTGEGAPETAWLLGSEQSDIEDAVAIAVLKGAHSPAASRHVKMEVEISPRLEPNLLHWPLEKTVCLPQRDLAAILFT